MSTGPENSESREQVLRIAEALFSERGYTAVTLKDIADALKVRQAALYYHVPGGKEQLFVEVITRSFRRHAQGLEAARAQAEPNVTAQLKAMAAWLLSQPPLDLARLARSDFPALAEEHARPLFALGDASLVQPIQQVIAQAYQRGETRLVDARVMASVFLSMIDTIHDLHRYKAIPKEVLSQDVIDVLIDGMRRR